MGFPHLNVCVVTTWKVMVCLNRGKDENMKSAKCQSLLCYAYKHCANMWILKGQRKTVAMAMKWIPFPDVCTLSGGRKFTKQFSAIRMKYCAKYL